MSSKTWLERLQDAVRKWVANHLPHGVVYFAVVRVWAYATTGKYDGTEVDELTVSESLSRWHAKTYEQAG